MLAIVGLEWVTPLVLAQLPLGLQYLPVLADLRSASKTGCADAVLFQLRPHS